MSVSIETSFSGISPSPGSRGTPYNGLYREALPKRGTFFRFQVHESVGISLVNVYERVVKSGISVFKNPKRAYRCILWL